MLNTFNIQLVWVKIEQNYSIKWKLGIAIFTIEYKSLDVYPSKNLNWTFEKLGLRLLKAFPRLYNFFVKILHLSVLIESAKKLLHRLIFFFKCCAVTQPLNLWQNASTNVDSSPICFLFLFVFVRKNAEKLLPTRFARVDGAWSLERRLTIPGLFGCEAGEMAKWKLWRK